MTDKNTHNREDLDEETRALVDEVDEQLENSSTTSSNQPSRSESKSNRDQNSEPTDESDDVGSVADTAWSLVLSSLGSVLTALIFVPLSKMPRRTSVYQKMIRMGFQALFKKTDAHVIVNTIYGDREVIPRPAEIDKEEGKVKTNNGEEWTLPDGFQTYHIGQSRVMWGVADDHALVDPVGARTAEKLDLEDAVYVQRLNRQKQSKQQGPTPTAQGPTPQVRADGGVHSVTGLAAKSLGRWNGEPFEDVYVNWANTNPDADGMVVSLEKHYEMYHSQGATEEMKKQEDRGRLAERFDGDKRTALIYVALLVGGIVLGMFGPSVASSLGGGGEAGTSISLMMQPLLGV
ncbi:hypothetical protein EL22_25285 [Halostagnicola sp. A56]|uniref:hypothetical protein n=1 Tax=Halostagnicola sp. A56 TaxID=1495067 RepID=UPI0004A04D9A|nr:hypothetical protein [Halostagnicola sp. A56]KDE56686.1 hypothetical protein EL22_25285 [Halostagnicola sp. A56]